MTLHTLLPPSAPFADLTVGQLRKNLIDLELAIAEEDDWARLAVLANLREQTLDALRRRELREVAA